MELLIPMQDSSCEVYNRELCDPIAALCHDELSERKLWVTDVNDALLDNVSRWIIYWNKEDKNLGIDIKDRKPIWLYIYSYGGDLEITSQIISLIQCSDTPVNTVALGVAYSAGAYIFLSGHKRFLLPNTYLLIHQGSGSNGGTFEQVQSNNDHYKEQMAWLKDFTLSHSTISKQMLSKRWVKEWYISNKDAIEYGMADKEIKSLSEVV